MMVSSRCCINFLPPPSSSSLPRKATNIASRQKKKERLWGNKSVLGAACVMISLQVDYSNLGDIVLAEEFKADIIEITIEKAGVMTVMRWSDKRSCAPWRLNSLETIVPENLPRPSARRRWEAVGFAGATAPAIKGELVGNSGCFSM